MLCGSIWYEVVRDKQFVELVRIVNQSTLSICESQIRTTLKRKAFEDAGIPMREVSRVATNNTEQAPQPAPAPLSVINRQTVFSQNAEVTLNMLNASEIDDVDGLSGGVKLEFDPDEDAAT
ncbi:unnamed protein product [Spodoptera littoralis]|uniref:Uncharacterized protein n=1 Tax=Spodoptera littoralis TaxID=7109 RepID=A0A9P0IKN7_SPOLI|nr:unnamed protein product [Spodoptera littoralis]CAH1647874.1 unnamed protein product [Spodoptera littoralis]